MQVSIQYKYQYNIHTINNWERTSSYIHRQSIRWKVHNIQTPGHKWRQEPNSEGSTETMCTWSDSNVVVEGLYRSAGTLHHLRLQHLTLLRVRTQHFQTCTHYSFTEEECAGSGELQTSFQPICILSKTLERAVHRQIENYLSEANLLPYHQSAYSCTLQNVIQTQKCVPNLKNQLWTSVSSSVSWKSQDQPTNLWVQPAICSNISDQPQQKTLNSTLSCVPAQQDHLELQISNPYDPQQLQCQHRDQKDRQRPTISNTWI